MVHELSLVGLLFTGILDYGLLFYSNFGVLAHYFTGILVVILLQVRALARWFFLGGLMLMMLRVQ